MRANAPLAVGLNTACRTAGACRLCTTSAYDGGGATLVLPAAAMTRAGSPLGARTGSRLSSNSLNITLTCGTVLLVLAIAHAALGSSAAAGSAGSGGSARARVRLLLQGSSLGSGEASHGQDGEAGLHAEQPSSTSGGDTSSGDDDGDNGDSPEGVTAGGGTAGQASVAAEALRPTLTADVDLATFAVPGTHCVVSPSHPKVRRRRLLLLPLLLLVLGIAPGGIAAAWTTAAPLRPLAHCPL